jgi:hypothetical protein
MALLDERSREDLLLLRGAVMALAGIEEFAAAKKNCNPVKSHWCVGKTGVGSCVPLSRQCAIPAKGVTASTAQAINTANSKAKGRVKKAATPAAPTPKTDPIKTNDKELKSTRAQLARDYGSALVTKAEQNTKRILQDAEVFVRVGSTDTLEKILGDRFRTSAELGVKTHSIPDLTGNYQTARNRVEAKSMGYDPKNTKPEDRPIYGYLAGNDMDGNAHADVSRTYGSIAIKLKKDVRDRTTFTGADSFKSGIASRLSDPNAASLATTTRFGHDIGSAKVPAHLRSIGKAAQRRQLQQAANAKGIDDLNNLAPTGNKYIEAQIHGQVTPKDIGEIHFKPKGGNDQPSPTVAQFAKDNNVPLFVNGKKVNPDTILKQKGINP